MTALRNTFTVHAVPTSHVAGSRHIESVAPPNQLNAAFERRPLTPIALAIESLRVDRVHLAYQGTSQERATAALSQHLADEARIESRLSPEDIKRRHQLKADLHFGTTPTQSARGHVLSSAMHNGLAELHSLTQELADVAGFKDFAQHENQQRENHAAAAAHHRQRAIDKGRIVDWDQVQLNGIPASLPEAERLLEYVENLYLQSAPMLGLTAAGGALGPTVAGAVTTLRTAASVKSARLIGGAAATLANNSGRVLNAQREHSLALEGSPQTHLPSAIALGAASSAVGVLLGVDRMLASFSANVINPARLPAAQGLLWSGVRGGAQVGAVTVGEASATVVQSFAERTGAKVANDKLHFFSSDYYGEMLAQGRDGALMGWVGGSLGQSFRGAHAFSGALSSKLESALLTPGPRAVDAHGAVLWPTLRPLGNHPDPLVHGLHFPKEEQGDGAWATVRHSTGKAKPSLKFTEKKSTAKAIEMEVTTDTGTRLAHIAAERDAKRPGAIAVTFKALSPMHVDKAAELLARFLGHTDGWLPRVKLLLQIDAFGDLVGYEGPSLLTGPSFADEQYPLIPSELLARTLSYLGFGVDVSHIGVEPGQSAGRYLAAPTYAGQKRMPAKHFADGAPGTGPGLADPTSFATLRTEPLRETKLLTPDELHQQGSQAIAFVIPETTHMLRATQEMRQGIHTDLAENAPVASAGTQQHERVQRNSPTSDIRHVELNSGHYLPYGKPPVTAVTDILQELKFDAEGRVISTFRRPGDAVSAQPFPTLTLRRSTQPDGSQILDAYIPWRKDPNPDTLKFLPHLRARLPAQSNGVVHIEKLDLADFPPGYLAAFLAQSLQAHEAFPTRQLTFERLFAYQLDQDSGVNLQQQVIAALEALHIKAVAARFEPDGPSGGALVRFIVDTEGWLPSNESAAQHLAHARGISVPGRMDISHPSRPLPEEGTDNFVSYMEQLFRTDLYLTRSRGTSTVSLLTPTTAAMLYGQGLDLAHVDRYGTLTHHITDELSSRVGLSVDSLIRDLKKQLEVHDVPVHAIRQTLTIGSENPLAQQFVQRVRHHHHSQGLSLPEAARAAAADILKDAPLPSSFGLTEPRDVHIAGNLVIIDAQRDPMPKALPRVQFTTPLPPVHPGTGNQPNRGDTNLDVLKALVGTSPVTKVEERLFRALTMGDPQRFKMLIDVLTKPNITSTQLAAKHQAPNANNDVTKLVTTLTQAHTLLQYSEVPRAITEFLQPVLAPNQTPQSYLRELLRNPTQWAMSRGLLDATPTTKLQSLDLSDLVFLQRLAQNNFSVKSLRDAEGIYLGKWYRDTSDRSRRLRRLLNPDAPNWNAVGLAYPDGPQQLKLDIDAELQRRRS